MEVKLKIQANSRNPSQISEFRDQSLPSSKTATTLIMRKHAAIRGTHPRNTTPLLHSNSLESSHRLSFVDQRQLWMSLSDPNYDIEND